MAMFKAVAFDAYGTLYDVYSVQQKCEDVYPGFGERISRTWRQKQLEYSWLRTLAGRYVDFWDVTKDALRYTLDVFELDFDEQTIESIMETYLHLQTYPEVKSALEAFRPRSLSILSNGSPRMLEAVTAATGLDEYIETIYSVDALHLYKPRPEVYQLCADGLGFDLADILFVSSNAWDVAGAKSFGFSVGWVNRFGLPMDRLGVAPDFESSDLLGLVQAVG